MFSWKKDKDPIGSAVDAVQKGLVVSKEKTKILDKAKMREQVIEVVKAQPGMGVKLGDARSVPTYIKDKIRAWDGVRNLILDGSIRTDSESSDHEIPLVIIVHGQFPVIPPLCYVTGDIYIPQWDPSRSTLKGMIRTIILEIEQTRIMSHQPSCDLVSCEGMMAGLALSHGEEINWASLEAARQAPRKPPPRKKRAPEFHVTDDTPQSFICPISLEVMSDPVTAADGHTYERDEIEDWLFAHSTSPLTNEELPNKKLEANLVLQKEIKDYHARAPSGCGGACNPAQAPDSTRFLVF